MNGRPVWNSITLPIDSNAGYAAGAIRSHPRLSFAQCLSGTGERFAWACLKNARASCGDGQVGIPDFMELRIYLVSRTVLSKQKLSAHEMGLVVCLVCSVNPLLASCEPIPAETREVYSVKLEERSSLVLRSSTYRYLLFCATIRRLPLVRTSVKG